MQNLIQSLSPEHMLRLTILGTLVMILFAVGVICDIIALIHIKRKPINHTDVTEGLLAKPWTLSDALLIVLTVVAILSLFDVCNQLLPMFGFSIETDYRQAISGIVQTLSLQIAVFAVMLSIMKARGISWRSAFGLERASFMKNIGLGVFSYAAIVPVLVVFGLLNIFLLTKAGVVIEHMHKQEVITIFVSPDLPIWLVASLAFMGVVTAPVMEELVFRGIFLPVAGKHSPLLLATILVSGVFAVIHNYAPGVIPLFILACTFSVAYIYSRSIVVPIVMHLLFNGVALCMLFLTKDVPFDTLGTLLADFHL
jgi:uncharacterized protein